MKLTPLRIEGAVRVDIEPIVDSRGFFARTWSDDEFSAHGLVSRPVQCSISYNHRKGTLRGMHFQASPHEEAKLVRCTQGSVYDVLLDLRPDSATYCMWIAEELTAQNHRMVHIPAGVAHGFQTLADDTEVFYQISETYHAESSRGVRWNDPAFGITWPLAARTISERDLQFPDFVR